MKKGFSLIELLVVVAIIGILAAVGIVAYSGYTASAKIKTLEANYNTIVKYITNEVMKCEIDSEIEAHILFPNKYHSCTSTAKIRNFKNISTTVISFLHNENTYGFKNPLNTTDTIVINNNSDCPRSSPGSPALGRINCGYKTSTDKVHCCACWGTGTNDTWSTTIDNPY